ncbi:hypothetical protein L6164_014574 [Bauhinia variegata]|uniref:Uncharacterized protein n=1 Tax=Bauhinia variegata TaxID=167791 RepID=A0ACB9NIB2_BAUVA|nr:hypothetical protein L6164_014574 [Bauhinia variegata]
MGSTQPFMSWTSNYEIAKDEDPFPLAYQLPSSDFSGNIGNGYFTVDWTYEFSMQDNISDVFPLMGSFPDPYETLSIEPTSSLKVADDDFCAIKNGCAVWNENDVAFDSDQQPLLLCKNGENGKEMQEDRKEKRCRKERMGSTIMLSRKTISEYFYMPITRAAKELNVGLTLLKKRYSFPSRKTKDAFFDFLNALVALIIFKSRSLMHNGLRFQELGMQEGQESEAKLRNAIEILEKEKKLLEEKPDLQLEDYTKRLRQACFKANYKKRKLMGMHMGSMDLLQCSLCAHERRDEFEDGCINDENEQHDINSLLPDARSY